MHRANSSTQHMLPQSHFDSMMGHSTAGMSQHYQQLTPDANNARMADQSTPMQAQYAQSQLQHAQQMMQQQASPSRPPQQQYPQQSAQQQQAAQLQHQLQQQQQQQQHQQKQQQQQLQQQMQSQQQQQNAQMQNSPQLQQQPQQHADQQGPLMPQQPQINFQQDMQTDGAQGQTPDLNRLKALQGGPQRPQLAHHRSISLGMHLHQLASQSMVPQSIPASADSLQSFGWPPAAPMQAGMMMSAAPTSVPATEFSQPPQMPDGQAGSNQAPGPVHLNGLGLTNTPLSGLPQPTANDMLPVAGTINQIGTILDDVVTLANNARELFRQGEHQVSSNCLGDLQKNLHRIGELGNQSLATVQAAGIGLDGSAHPDASAQRQVQPPTLHLQTSQQHLQNAPQMQMQPQPPQADENARVSPAARKRPMQADDDMADHPFKSLRSEGGTPVHTPLPPPSAPPAVSDAVSAAMMHLRAPQPPHSAPPMPTSAPAGQMSQMPNMVHGLQPSLMANTPQLSAGGMHSLQVSPSTPQAPFEFPLHAQNLFGASGNSNGVVQSMPPSPTVRQEGRMRQGSLHEAMPMTPNGSANGDGSRPAPKLARSSLQMSTLSSENSSGNQSALDSGPSSPEDSSNGESDQEGDDSNDNVKRQPIKHRRHRNSGPLSSGASFDLSALEDQADTSNSTDKNAIVSPELRAQLEGIFHTFLTNVCSDLEATDDRGELLHQTLMAKKMAKLDESPDFRPFKFRIQAFTNAFQAEVYRNGISEVDCSIKKIKQYLWTQPYISRFNEDGKKAKSKGNHIWIVEAKKIPEGGWQFREFDRKIAGAPEKIAYVGLQWTWPLKVWDPQASSTSINAVFSPTRRPAWIQWDDAQHTLSGTPTAVSESGEICVTAHYVHAGQLHELEHSFYLQVASLAADDMQISDAGPSASATAAQVASAMGQPMPNADAMGGQPSLMGVMAGLQPSGLSFINGQPPANFPAESINHHIVDPAKVPAVLDAIAFPFTPPLHTDGRPQYFQHLSMESALLTPQQSEAGGAIREMPVSDSQLSSAMHSPLVSQSMSNSPFHIPAQQLHQQIAGLMPPASSHPLQQVQQGLMSGQNTPQVPLSPMVPMNQAQSQLTDAMMGMTSDDGKLHQVRNIIENQQQAQASHFMLSIPTSKAPSDNVSMPGQRTPMSSLPNDMGSQLPSLGSDAQASNTLTPASGPIISPAVHMNMDGLNEQNLRLHIKHEPQQ